MAHGTNGLIQQINLCTGTCYKYKVLRDKLRNWYDSRVECQRAGGDLAKIETNEEWQFVQKGTGFKNPIDPLF